MLRGIFEYWFGMFDITMRKCPVCGRFLGAWNTGLYDRVRCLYLRLARAEGFKTVYEYKLAQNRE